MNKVRRPIFERNFVMFQNLKLVDNKRQKLRNDYP